MKIVTPELVKGLWNHMGTKYKTGWKHKPNAWEAKLAATVLDVMNIIDKKTFMEQYAFILGRTIYTPFVPGEIQENYSLEKQIACCVHEHFHWLDACRMGKWKWNYAYVTSSRRRAVMEARAYVTNIEIYHWYCGKILSPAKIADVLKNYNCNVTDRRIAEDIMESNVRTIKQGGYSSNTTIEALKYLTTRL